MRIKHPDDWNTIPISLLALRCPSVLLTLHEKCIISPNNYKRNWLCQIVLEKTLKKLFSGRFGAYVLAVGLLVVTTVLGELATKYASVDPSSIDMLYILSVAISASYFGFGPSAMLSILSTFAFDVFFVPPIYSFTVSTPQDAINLLILLVVCVVISFLSPKIRT